MQKKLTCKRKLKKNIIKKSVFNREIALCKKLSKEMHGKCEWGRCKDCGVVPLLYKFHKGQLLEDPTEIRKIKTRIFK